MQDARPPGSSSRGPVVPRGRRAPLGRPAGACRSPCAVAASSPSRRRREAVQASPSSGRAVERFRDLPFHFRRRVVARSARPLSKGSHVPPSTLRCSLRNVNYLLVECRLGTARCRRGSIFSREIVRPDRGGGERAALERLGRTERLTAVRGTAAAGARARAPSDSPCFRGGRESSRSVPDPRLPGDDPKRPATGGAGFDIDAEDAPETLCPADRGAPSGSVCSCGCSVPAASVPPPKQIRDLGSPRWTADHERSDPAQQQRTAR